MFVPALVYIEFNLSPVLVHLDQELPFYTLYCRPVPHRRGIFFFFLRFCVCFKFASSALRVTELQCYEGCESTFNGVNSHVLSVNGSLSH